MTKFMRGYNEGSDDEFVYFEDERDDEVFEVRLPHDNVDVNTLHGEVHTYKLDVNEINTKYRK